MLVCLEDGVEVDVYYFFIEVFINFGKVFELVDVCVVDEDVGDRKSVV